MALSNRIDGASHRFVDAGGIRTHYAEAGSGAPIILIHGGGAGADCVGNWRSSLHLFAKRGRAIAVDMVGFGQTDKPDPAKFVYSQPNRNKHMVSFIEALGLKGVNLIGNSMGGATSIGVAVERPDLVNRVVLMGSAGVRMTISDELKSIVNYDYTTEGMRKIVRGLTNPDFAVNEDLVSYRHALSIAPDVKAAYNATMGWIRENGGLHYEEDYIRRVKVPALVVNGKSDKVVPLSCAYRLLELIDNSWGYIIPHCGHWAMMEHPTDFAGVALNFLLDGANP